MKEIFHQIQQQIEAANRIIIFTHSHPDGDCYGSAFGLRGAINLRYPDKKIFILGEPLPSNISFLGHPDTISDEEIKGALGIAVDTATTHRLSDQRWNLCSFFIKLDHHIEMDRFGDLSWVKISSSCSENIAVFLQEMGYQINSAIAKALFTGMITDNGRFMYRGVNASTFKIAEWMYSTGLNPTDEIYPLVYSKDTAMIPFNAWYLQTMKFNGAFLHNVITKEVIARFKVDPLECPAWLGYMSGWKGVEIWAQFIEYDDYYRCEFRSLKYPVNEIAMKFGGGGHRNAAGAKLKTSAEVDACIEYIKSLNVLAN